MIAPRYKRAQHRLKPGELARLVAMRDAGTTWKEIGLVFNKQDCACKALYDKAKRLGENDVRPVDKAA